jgi:hypothetical protein
MSYCYQPDALSPNLSSSTTTSSDYKLKIKLKKDALEYVDISKEYQSDSKYKTELCKSWTESGFCAYGNKCRFAHGRHELFEKSVNHKKYKQKECLSFFKNKYCCYGSRCHFKHEERKLPELTRSYYNHQLSLYSSLTRIDVMNITEEQLLAFNSNVTPGRLSLFKKEKKTMRFLNSLEVYDCRSRFTLSQHVQ